MHVVEGSKSTTIALKMESDPVEVHSANAPTLQGTDLREGGSFL